jgi:surface antigen
MKKILMMSCVALFSLTACENMQSMQGNKQMVGTGAGALVGGILGSNVGGGKGQLWATGAGALIGALVGSEIGASLDNADRAAAGGAYSRAHAAPVGETVSWNNPESGNHGTVTPTRDGYSSSGRYCREYQQTIVVGGKTQTGYGTACQQPDGTWEIVK